MLRPPTRCDTAYHDYCQDLTKLAQQWTDLMKQDLAAVNTQLKEQHLQPLSAVMPNPTVPSVAVGAASASHNRRN